MKIVFSPCPRYDWVRSGAISRSGRAYDGRGPNRVRGEQAASRN